MNTRNLMVLALTGALTLSACGGDDENGNNADSVNSANSMNSANGTNNTNSTNSTNNTNGAQNSTNSVDVDMGEPLPEGEERTPTVFSVLPPIPSSCDNPSALQKLPFIFNTRDVVPLVTGDIVNGQVIQPNVTLDTGALVAERTRIHDATETVCTSDADCGGNFKCAAAGMPGAKRQCTVQTGLEFIPGTVVNDYDTGLTGKKQLVAVLIENTTSLVGRLPVVSGELYDESGEKDLLQDTARATDLERIHRESLESFALNLASVTDPLSTKVGLWWYAGQVPAEVRPLVDPSALEDHFTNDLSVGESLVETMPEPVPKPGNIYQAMLKVIDRDMGLDQYDDHEKFMVVFTDGPNEVYDADATYAKVLETMQAEGIHVFIVHLDSAVDASLIRDLPTLWAGNTACQEDPTCTGARACATDADCPNYTECRPATVYGETAEDAVTQTPLSYCMPSYDETGRIGPIDNYADLACRTGGNYVYVTEPNALLPYFRVLPSAFDGQFSIETDFSALGNPDLDPDFYRLSGMFVGTLGEGDLGAALTAPVERISASDSRPLIRLGRVRN